MFASSLDWFPKCRKDLDVFTNKVLEAGRELKNDASCKFDYKDKN